MNPNAPCTNPNDLFINLFLNQANNAAVMGTQAAEADDNINYVTARVIQGLREK